MRYYCEIKSVSLVHEAESELCSIGAVLKHCDKLFEREYVKVKLRLYHCLEVCKGVLCEHYGKRVDPYRPVNIVHT